MAAAENEPLATSVIRMTPPRLEDACWKRLCSEGCPMVATEETNPAGPAGGLGCLNAHPLVRRMPRDGGNILRLACGLVEQLIEFARRELTPPAIRNANSVSGCFELAGFGDRDHRIDSVRLAASTVF
jgi:hypothetical protein